ncbi:MAG: hypothetical protein R8M37_00615 [Alphaproteobacteria bacterium]|nr:hypothetical protein [Alphaproteobacteria bacterium]
MSVCKAKYCIFVAKNGGCTFKGSCAIKDENLNWSEETVAKMQAAQKAANIAEEAKKAREAERENARLVFVNVFQRGNGCMAPVVTEKTK